MASLSFGTADLNSLRNDKVPSNVIERDIRGQTDRVSEWTDSGTVIIARRVPFVNSVP